MDYPNVAWKEHAYFWPVTYFRDPLHTNPDGADKLTKQAVKWYIDDQNQPVSP